MDNYDVLIMMDKKTSMQLFKGEPNPLGNLPPPALKYNILHLALNKFNFKKNSGGSKNILGGGGQTSFSRFARGAHYTEAPSTGLKM